MKRLLAALMMLSGLLVAGGAKAAATMNINQVGNDVVASITGGSINTTGLSIQFTSPAPGALWPSQGLAVAGSDAVAVNRFNGVRESRINAVMTHA